MEHQAILNLVQEYSYWILYPLMIIEGPIVTLIAGGLSALGILNVKIVFLLSVLGDLTMDIGLYYFGFFGNNHLNRWINTRSSLKRKREKVQTLFNNHGGKIIFLVKISSGLCYITFITAGMVKMPLKKFLKFSLAGGIIWSGLLTGLGYFYGQLYQEISDKIEGAGFIILSLAIISLIAIAIFKAKFAFKSQQKND